LNGDDAATEKIEVSFTIYSFYAVVGEK